MTVSPASDSPASVPCVLVVDDSPVNLALAQAMLKDRGLSVHTASSVKEAVAKARVTAYALILMDIRMSDGDGIAATREIRALEGVPSRVPIVALTANTEPHEAKMYLAAGMDGFIAKPLYASALDAVLQRWCGLSPGPVDVAAFADLRAGITPESLDELIARFLTEAPQRIARLRVAVDRQNHETIEREAHTLKSVAALFGARPLEAAAAEIERAALGRVSRTYPIAELSELTAATCLWLDRGIRRPFTPPARPD